MSLKLLWTDIGVQYRGKGIITAWAEEMERRGWEIVRERERWRECDLAFFGSDSQLFPEPLGEIPTVLYFWGWMPARMLDRGWQEIATRQLQMMARCTRILVSGLVTMDQVACFGLPSYLCLPGVDSRALDLGEDVEREPQVMFISRLAPHKHLDALIRAVSLMTPRPGLLVVGPGDAEPFRRLAQELDVPARFAELTDAEKATELRRSAVLVHPSSYEGFGLPALEGLYCGTPVIVFDIPQSRWSLQEDAYFFSSVEGLAQAIAHVLEHPEEARAKAARGQERVRKSLTLEHACERLAPHIHAVIKEHLAVRIRREPERAAEIYDAEHRRNAMGPVKQFDPGWARHWRAQEFIRVLKEHGVHNVLDVGCGPVYPTIFAQAGFKVIAVDISPECIKQAATVAKRWGVADLIYLVRDAADLHGIYDNAYDAVVHGEVWEHIPDPRKVITEGLRVLKSGGILVATTPVGEHHWDPMHLRTFDDFSLIELINWTRANHKVTLKRFEKIAEEGTEPSCFLVVLEKP